MGEAFDLEKAERLYQMATGGNLPNPKYLDELLAYIQRYPQWLLKEFVPKASEAVDVTIETIRSDAEEEMLLFMSLMAVWGFSVLEEAALWEAELLLQSDPETLRNIHKKYDAGGVRVGNGDGKDEGGSKGYPDKYIRYTNKLLEAAKTIFGMEEEVPSTVMRRTLQALTSILSPTLQVCAKYHDHESFSQLYKDILTASDLVYESAKRARDAPVLAHMIKFVATELVLYSIPLGTSASIARAPRGPSSDVPSSILPVRDNENEAVPVNAGATDEPQFSPNSVAKDHPFISRESLSTREGRALRTIIAMIPTAKSSKDSSAIFTTSLLSNIGFILRARPQYTPRIMALIPKWYNRISALSLPAKPAKKGTLTAIKQRWTMKAIGFETFQLFRSPALRAFSSDIEHALKQMNTPEYQNHTSKARGIRPGGGRRDAAGGQMPSRPTTPPLAEDWYGDSWFVSMAIAHCNPDRLDLSQVTEAIVETLRSVPDAEFSETLTDRLPRLERLHPAQPPAWQRQLRQKQLPSLLVPPTTDLRSSGLVRKRVEEEAEDEDEDTLQDRLAEEAKKVKIDPAWRGEAVGAQAVETEMQAEYPTIGPATIPDGGEFADKTAVAAPAAIDAADVVIIKSEGDTGTALVPTSMEVEEKGKKEEAAEGAHPLTLKALAVTHGDKFNLPSLRLLDHSTAAQLREQATSRVLKAGPALFRHILHTDAPDAEAGLTQHLVARPADLGTLVHTSKDSGGHAACTNQDMIADWTLIISRAITTLGLSSMAASKAMSCGDTECREEGCEDGGDHAFTVESLVAKVMKYVEESPRSRFEIAMTLFYELWHRIGTLDRLIEQRRRKGDGDGVRVAQELLDALRATYIIHAERFQYTVIRTCETTIFASVQETLVNINEDEKIVSSGDGDYNNNDDKKSVNAKTPQEITRQMALRETLLNRFMVDVPHITPKMMDELWERLTRDSSLLQQQLQTVSLCVLALQSLANLRPKARSQSMEFLLLCCMHRDRIIRSACIVMVKQWYPDHPVLASLVEKAALMGLYDMVKFRVARPKSEEEMVQAGDNKKAAAAVGTQAGARAVGVEDEKEKEEAAGREDQSRPEAEPTTAEEQDGGNEGVGGSNTVNGKEKKESAEGTEGEEKKAEQDREESEEYIVRHLELYFALCSRRHELLSQLLKVFAEAKQDMRDLLCRAVQPLIHSISGSPGLIKLLGAFPQGAEQLALRILEILTENTLPSYGLVQEVMRMYTSRHLNARFLIPIVLRLEKARIVSCLPDMVRILNGTEEPRAKIRELFLRLVDPPQDLAPPPGEGLNVAVQPKLQPDELLKILHNIDQQAGIRRTIEAIQICLSCKQVFTPEVIASGLQSLVLVQSRVPTLFVRTMMQATMLHPQMSRFMAGLLETLVGKRVWKNPTLWKGVIKVARMIAPLSFNAILSLPPNQMRDLITSEPVILRPLIDHVEQLPQIYRDRLLPILESLKTSLDGSGPPTMLMSQQQRAHSGALGGTEGASGGNNEIAS